VAALAANASTIKRSTTRAPVLLTLLLDI